MKNLRFYSLAFLAMIMLTFSACSTESSTAQTPQEQDLTTENHGGGQSSVQDDVSQKDVVKVAVSSPDHTTFVAAVQAAKLVDALSNAGPFTVFAPTNAAFDLLPKGTVEGLLKPEQKETLTDILYYHVTVSAYDEEKLYDGQQLGQVNDGKITITKKDGKFMVNDANIIASVRASNGVVHVIDKVLLPQ